MLKAGGSFAPPLSDAKLADYKKMINGLPRNYRVRDAMEQLLVCSEKWWDLPESTKNGTPHPSGVGIITPLEEGHVATLDPHIPWDDELDGMAAAFEQIDPVHDKALRDAAFHLLWHVKELSLGREPITTDKL